MEMKACAQSLAFLQNAISRSVLFFLMNDKYIDKVIYIDNRPVRTETIKITIHKWYDGFRHLRDKAGT